MKKNSNLDLNVAIIALYTVVPSWHGAADISRLMLKYFPLFKYNCITSPASKLLLNLQNGIKKFN